MSLKFREAVELTGRSKPITGRSKKYLEEPLYKRLFRKGSSEIAIRQQLNVFLEDSKRVYKWEVDDTIKKLRDHNRFYPALKLSEAMPRRGMWKTVSDQAIHLDLVAKARGVTAAEHYFIALPESSKNLLTYGALLNCYCKELMTEKAEALMEKMKELKLDMTSMSFNSLMTLYTKTGQPERVPSVIQEMKSSNVIMDTYTYNVQMRAAAATNNISEVERIMEEMKRDERVAEDWTTYSNLASIYVNAGMMKEAEGALKDLEKKNTRRDLSAYQFLITLYGHTRNLIEVYRTWRSLRLAYRATPNICYLNMIKVLVDLKDLPGAEKCFEEWVAGCSKYDIRVANVLTQAYLEEGSFDKAEMLKRRTQHRRTNPNVKTWEIYFQYYLREGETKLALDCIGRAVSCGRGDGAKWVPSEKMTRDLLKHFEERQDVESAEKFVRVLKKAADSVDVCVFESLIRMYASAGKTNPIMRRRLKMEKVELSEESKRLLDLICTE